ncbi:MAG: PAS domain-containing protein [Gammaproteobacteria bacterium]|nr:MAG: PAS domain-containing protein [Gammaproteobacteria bacterium]
MTNPKLTIAFDSALEAELAKFRQHQALLDRTEKIAHIGHFEWSYELDRLLSCSEEYARIHDMTVDEVMQAHSSREKVIEQVHPDDRVEFKKSAQALRRDKFIDIEFRLLTKNGEIRHIREFAIEVSDEDGTEIGTFGILQDISERVKHERDLEYRDELARQTEAITDIGHFIYDEDSERYVYMSDGCARIYGVTVQQCMTNVQSIEDDLSDIHEEDVARVKEEYMNYRDTGQDCAIEYRIRRADGEIRWVRELTRAKRRKEGRVVQTLGVVQDITERVRREQDMLFKDEITRQTETIIDIGYFLFDERENHNLYVSPGQARIVGMSIEEYYHRIETNEDYLQLVYEEDRELVWHAYNEVFYKEGGWEIEYRIMREDGEIRWVHEIGREHSRDAHGVITSIGIIQDITEQKNIEQELLYKDALANQAEAITEIGHFIYDEIKQKYLYVSPGLARIHGKSENEMVTRIVSWEGDLDVIHPEDRENVRRAYDRFLAGGGDWRVDYRLIRSDGEIRWIREMGRAYVINHGIPEQTIGVMQDITEQKNSEREIIKAKENLEQQVVERTRELANTVKQLQEEIEEREKIAAELDFLANHDALTGLPSLRLCKDRLDQSLAEARRNRQTSAVMFLDLDGFKTINDEHGHEFGDLVLKVTADRIRAEIRETDTVARIGGDEFVIILSSLPENKIAERIASSLIEQLAQPIFIEDVGVAISASIGISLYPSNGITAEELIRSADKAMYRVKRAGKNDFGFVGTVKF